MLEAQNTLMSIINARRSGSRPRTPRSGMSYSRQRRSEKSELLAPHFGNRLARATVSYLISGRSTFVCPMDRCGSQSPADLCTMACTLTILSTYHLLHVLDQAGASICNSDRHAFRRVLPCESLKRGSICFLPHPMENDMLTAHVEISIRKSSLHADIALRLCDGTQPAFVY